MILVKRKQGMSSADFAAYWLGPHAALALRLERLKGYRVNLVERWLGTPEDWDGIAELWFESEADMVAAYESMAEALGEDRPKFIEMTRVAVVREEVVLDEASGA
jgi:uncharacterized protein (TIGR02118 family)